MQIIAGYYCVGECSELVPATRSLPPSAEVRPPIRHARICFRVNSSLIPPVGVSGGVPIPALCNLIAEYALPLYLISPRFELDDHLFGSTNKPVDPDMDKYEYEYAFFFFDPDPIDPRPLLLLETRKVCLRFPLVWW